MAIALSALRTRLEVLWDVAGSVVLTSSEKNQLINDGYRALWSDVCAINKDFRVSSETFTLTTTNTRALPATFRETRAVRSDPGTESELFLPRWTARIGGGSWTKSYRLHGTNLVIEPISRCAGTYAHDYQPQVTALSADGDNVDAELEQFQDYIIHHAVIQALTREESPIGDWKAIFDEDRARVRRWASDQRSADPDVVEDVRRVSIWNWGPP